jgi:HEAT repeats
VPPGGVSVRAEDGGRYRVVARGAPRFQVLQELARAAGFEIEIGAGDPSPLHLIEVDLDGVRAEEALAEILGNVPRQLHYEPAAPGADAARLARVTVGLELPGRVAAAAPPPPPEPGSTGLVHHPRGTRRGAERALSEEDRLAEIEAKRHASDPADRARAAELMEPEQDLPALLAFLADDPSGEVRARAAESLADVPEGESAFRVREGLLGALRDPDPAVVAAAVTSLEDLYDVLPDPRIRARVLALGRRGDPRVRAAVDSFREWTEDEP